MNNIALVNKMYNNNINNNQIRRHNNTNRNRYRSNERISHSPNQIVHSNNKNIKNQNQNNIRTKKMSNNNIRYINPKNNQNNINYSQNLEMMKQLKARQNNQIILEGELNNFLVNQPNLNHINNRNNMFQNNNNNNYNQRISNVGRTKNNRGLPKKSPIPIQKGFMTGKYLNKSNISTISNYSNNTYNASCHSSDPYIINNISQISGYSNYSQYNQRNGPVLENNRIRPYSNNTRTLLSKNKKTNGSISYNRNNLKRNAKSSNNIRNKQNNNNNSPNSFKAKTNNYINNNSINNMNKNKYVNKSPNIHDDYFLNNINGKLNNNYVNQIQNPNYYNMLNSNNSFSNLSSVSSVSNNLTNASYFTKMVQNNNISNQNMNLYNTKNHQNQNNKNNNINYINRQNMRPMTSDNYKGKSNNSKTAKKNNVNNDIINQNNPLFNLNPNEINYQNYNSNENKQKVNIMLNNLNKLGNFNNYMNGYNTYSHANKRQRSANLPVRKNNNYNNINPMVNLHIINKGQIINNNYNNINNMNNNMNNNINNLYVYKYDVSQNNINQIKNNTNSKLNNSRRKKNIIRNNYFNGISDDEINMNMNNIKFNQMNNIINENQNNPRNLNPKERIRNNSSTGMGITGELNNLLNTRNNIRQRNMLPQKRINNNNNINNHIHQNLNHSQLSAQNRIQNPLKKTYIAKRIRKIHHFTHVGFNGEKDKDYNQDIAFLEKNFANNNTFLYMAVCDGHGVEGHQVSGFIKRTLPKDLSNALVNKEILTSDKNKKKKIYNIIGSTFIKVNEKLISNESINSIFSGTTCVSLIYTPIKLICANIGDSRAVLGRYDKKNKKWISINLSRDHKPTEEDEAKRILKKGGRIKPFIDEETGNEVGPLRVWVKDDEVPGLAMTRSFGDRVAAIAGTICVPEIKEYAFHEGDKFVIIASDGIWEFISSEECINIVGKFYENNDVVQCCEYLYNESRKRWIKEEEVVDDITMLLVFFD
jgi:serine/threonine protein phosphatase PrpC